MWTTSPQKIFIDGHILVYHSSTKLSYDFFGMKFGSNLLECDLHLSQCKGWTRNETSHSPKRLGTHFLLNPKIETGLFEMW